MLLLEVESSQLVLVDYQPRLLSVIFEASLVLANATRLAQAAQWLQVPTFGTEQNPAKLGENAAPIKALCQRTLSKMQFSAAAGLLDWLRLGAKPAFGNARSLPKHLQKAAPAAAVRNSIVIAGCEAHICLLQTALELLADEFEVWVVTDACSSRSERNRDAAFDRLAGAGAELLSTEMVLFEWLRSAEQPQFKAIQGLIKQA